jgi:hypothetical protein
MTQEHPINPPPELVREWATTNGTSYEDLSALCQNIATQAARWGADTELEGCCEWLSVPCPSYGRELRNARRPELLSLKERGLKALLECYRYIPDDLYGEITEAIESLPD